MTDVPNAIVPDETNEAMVEIVRKSTLAWTPDPNLPDHALPDAWNDQARAILRALAKGDA